MANFVSTAKGLTLEIYLGLKNVPYMIGTIGTPFCRPPKVSARFLFCLTEPKDGAKLKLSLPDPPTLG